jgi:hypothetical protein
MANLTSSVPCALCLARVPGILLCLGNQDLRFILTGNSETPRQRHKVVTGLALKEKMQVAISPEQRHAKMNGFLNYVQRNTFITPICGPKDLTVSRLGQTN